MNKQTILSILAVIALSALCIISTIEIKKQDALIDTLQIQSERTDKVNIELKKVNEDLQLQLERQATELKKLQEQVNEKEKQIDTFQQDINNADKEIKSLKEQVALKKKREAQARLVAAGESVKKSEPVVVSRNNNDQVAKEFYVEATAYTAYCAGCSGTTATGINLRENPNLKVIAVDPNVIPLGSKVYVEGYGYAVAGDTGGAIKGNKVDLFMPSKSDAYDWGRRSVKIRILQ